jgi:hypothetical protein
MKSTSAFLGAVLGGMSSLCISAHAQSVDVSATGACFQYTGQCDYSLSVTNNIGGDYRIYEFATIAAGYPIGTPPGWTGVPFGPVWTADSYDTAIAAKLGDLAIRKGA